MNLWKMENSMKIIRPGELAEMMNVNPVTIWRMQKRGELPPRRKFTNRCVGWLESEIREWMENRPYADPEAEPEALEEV